MCLEQIMAWFNTNGTGISAVAVVVTLIAIGVQAFFAGKLFCVSKRQKEISEWMLLAEMRRERELLTVKLMREKGKLESLKGELEDSEKDKERQEQEGNCVELTEEELERLKKELDPLESEHEKLKQEREQSNDQNINNSSNPLSYSYPENKKRTERIYDIKLKLNRSENLKKIKADIENLRSSMSKVDKSIVDWEKNIDIYEKKISQTKESLMKDIKNNQT